MAKMVPLRKYIFDRLYHPTHGYFCKPNFQVGQLKAPIDFKNLIGYDDYQRELADKYPPNAWLTPCEIFKPYYGMTIASYLKEAHQRLHGKDSIRKKIKIVEAGAGTGSAAESILYYFSNFHRQLLPLVEYSIIEISPSLCGRIDQKLTRAYPHLIRNRQIKIVNKDISDHKESQPCFGLFFEVLDNMPHDKVLWNSQKKAYDRFVTACVDSNEQDFLSLESDPLIEECLQLYQNIPQANIEPQGFIDKMANYIVSRMVKKNMGISKDVFLPTYMLRFLKRVNQNMPNCHFVISDFDHLITSVPGINAPIVSRKGFKSQEKKDFDTYLIERGEADIFFPVNFQLLAEMHKAVLGKEAKVVKSYDFMSEFGFEIWAQTKSNFNPIRQDFGNTSFLVTEIPSKQ